MKTAPRPDAAGHRARTACGAALAAVWLALRVPHFAVRYAFGWDSSQFARALFEFNIEKHQPHPPGYPLWVLVSRLLMPLFGQPYTPQVALALLFTLGALPPFWWLARRMFGPAGALAATVALAFSPLTSLYASVPLTYAADLFASCWTGLFALCIWRGESKYAVPAWLLLALTTGFRQSGSLWLVPLLAVASLRSWKKPAPVLWGVSLAAGVFLAWYLPVAALEGGLRKVMLLTRTQALGSFHTTSVLCGATAMQHFHMLVGMVMCLGTALGAVVLAAVYWRWRARNAARPTEPVRGELPRTLLWLWLAPSLLVTALLHFGAPGYLLLSMPPLVLLSFNVAARGLDAIAPAPGVRRRMWLRTASVVAAVSLVVSYFPYPALFSRLPALGYAAERTTPRLPLVIERSQRELARLLRSLPGNAAVVCALDRPDAPDIRTVTFDFPDRDWIALQETGLVMFPARGSSGRINALPSGRPLAWIFAPEGLSGPLQYAVAPGAVKLAANEVFSFWVTPAAAAAVSGAE